MLMRSQNALVVIRNVLRDFLLDVNCTHLVGKENNFFLLLNPEKEFAIGGDLSWRVVSGNRQSCLNTCIGGVEGSRNNLESSNTNEDIIEGIKL